MREVAPPRRVESEIVMADGDYAAKTDTLKLMKRRSWRIWRRRGAEAAERSTSSQRSERDGETRSIKISNNVMV